MAGEDIHLNTSSHNFCASKDCQIIDQPVRILFVKKAWFSTTCNNCTTVILLKFVVVKFVRSLALLLSSRKIILHVVLKPFKTLIEEELICWLHFSAKIWGNKRYKCCCLQLPQILVIIVKCDFLEPVCVSMMNRWKLFLSKRSNFQIR